ncbi:MAG: MgtC/SapB family protein [Gammaproteobacteria bacterium]|nr:MgtC/SapB family protein [Gammaproteobacteria bacterium]NIR90075.1 MgtC/SapB family protein [Gammaproteobacteria bacterium]NIU03279.1 MgtC/SapB family protein [Gammaproteobacteria bacterium]NIV50773.1 MgtC/SapB family protein [Gammaproteobacteria bacterium]NIV75359.1 MgtC/SapB family protein [Gammaproteobacteria bacterium]
MPEFGDNIDVVLLRIGLAVVAGGLIGFERLHRGRPAGFRTHTLVCTASSLLMLLAAFQWQFVPGGFMETVRVDPTRMAQGIMTGIGFLGAGVIVKERLTVRGLTTAASIWMTAALGIIYGLGFYTAALAGTVVTLLVLSLFQYLEQIMPTSNYAQLEVSFAQPNVLSEDEILKVLKDHKIECVHMGYRHDADAGTFHYETVMRTGNRVNFRRVAEALGRHDAVRTFTIDPTGE